MVNKMNKTREHFLQKKWAYTLIKQPVGVVLSLFYINFRSKSMIKVISFNGINTIS